MSDAIFAGYESLDARMKVVDIIANNLANAQTNGFKRDFAHVLELTDDDRTRIVVESKIDLTPGNPIATGRELDAAIDGPGFFAIETVDGTRYTRNGGFLLNGDGDLVVADGHRVLDSGDAPIFVGRGSLQIQEGGDIVVDGNVAGTIRVVTFDDASLLRKEGLSLFEWTGEESGVQDVLEPRIKGGHLEQSNVESVTEMVRLVSAYRDFESVTQTLRTIWQDMDQAMLAELGRLT